jgi:hypothetical protein
MGEKEAIFGATFYCQNIRCPYSSGGVRVGIINSDILEIYIYIISQHCKSQNDTYVLISERNYCAQNTMMIKLFVTQGNFQVGK